MADILDILKSGIGAVPEALSLDLSDKSAIAELYAAQPDDSRFYRGFKKGAESLLGMPSTILDLNDLAAQGIRQGAQGIRQGTDFLFGQTPYTEEAGTGLGSFITPNGETRLTDVDRNPLRGIDFGDMGIGFEDVPDNVTEQLNQLSDDLKGQSGSTATQTGTSKKEDEGIAPDIAIDNVGRGDAPDAPQDEVKTDPLEDAFSNAMKAYNEALTGEVSDESIDKYKEQFAKATGVDVSGKVDKSRALQAFGLALMQNQAGKGFNVSKLLTSLGEAGEKAEPAMEKARAEARAAQLAGGKFGLEQAMADRNSQISAAKTKVENIKELIKQEKDFANEVYLKQLEGFETRKTENLKAKNEIDKELLKPEEKREYDKDFPIVFASGQGPAEGWKIRMAYDKTQPDQAILINADSMTRKYIDGRSGIDDALDLIDVMKNASRDIADGGGTVKFAFDRFNGVAKALFPDLNTGQPTNEEEYSQALNMIMGRFKRFLTQETGNGISNRDVDIWEREIMKKPSWFQNFDATQNALDLLEDTFIQKREEFDAGLDHLYDPNNHRSIEQFSEIENKYGTLDQVKGSQGILVLQDGRLVRGG